jgi:hypothetical protein
MFESAIDARQMGEFAAARAIPRPWQSTKV